MNNQSPIDELLDRDRYKNYVLVSDWTDSGMSAECIEAALPSSPQGARVSHLTWGFTLLWQRSRHFRARDPRHNWPNTADLAATPVTIGLWTHL